MRICINAAAANQGGAVTHLTNLLPNLAGLDTNDHYLGIAPQPTLDRLAGVLEDSRFEAEVYPHPPVQSVRRITFDQFRVPIIARRYRAVDSLAQHALFYQGIGELERGHFDVGRALLERALAADGDGRYVRQVRSVLEALDEEQG